MSRAVIRLEGCECERRKGVDAWDRSGTSLERWIPSRLSPAPLEKEAKQGDSVGLPEPSPGRLS